MIRGIADIVTSQAPTFRVPSLKTSFIRKSREEILDQAHVTIQALEVRVGVANRLISIASRIRACQVLPDLDYKVMGKMDKEDILELDRSVDECLFGGRAVSLAFAKQFDKKVVKYIDHINNNTTELKTYITALEGRLPVDLKAELTSFANHLIIPQDTVHIGVPLLRAAYNSKANDEIRDKAHGAIQALEELLCRAKAMALRSLPHFGRNDGFESVPRVVHDMLDNIGDLVLLRGYVDKLFRTKTVMGIKVPNKRTMTSFMVDRFDRATSRLASRIKDQISTLEGFAGPGRDARPYNGGQGQSRDLMSLIKQGNADVDTWRSLRYRLDDMEQLAGKQGDPRALSVHNIREHMVAEGHAFAWNTLADRIEGDIRFRDGVRVNLLGRDFVAKVLETGHDLIKGHVLRYRQLNSDLERLLGLSPAEAAARFPVVYWAVVSTRPIDSTSRG
ncbi:hypothetical protein CEP54_011768 [Fusarium duplospermum]|uniref:Uncharacterized protein n=1 Tax=Fusarium duplospermum TaxID=1325734 RepID=A0A428PCG1_9HYPO|nr:hypothetical protein CEP54_011768 [Fusarium duplospermum]